MAKRQFFGIKYPFTSEGSQHFYLDANESMRDKVRSEVLHVVFTPKGQRVRMPEFGTDLIKHIFTPNDDTSWEAIRTEVSESVSRWVPNVKLNNIQVVKNDNDEHEVFVRIDYGVLDGNKVTNDSVAVQI